MIARLSPQREAEIRKHIATLVYETYGQQDTERSLAIAGAVIPAVQAAVAAELAVVRAERDRALAVLERTQNRNADLAAERDELTRRDITSPLAVILRHGDMSQTVRQEIRNLLADAEAGS